MATPEHAPQSAVHNQPGVGDTQRAGVPHAHARQSVPDGTDDALKLTERNLRRLQDRWGTRIEEPASEPAPADVDEDTWRAILRGLTMHLHLVRDPLPSMRAVRADYKTGLEDAQQQSATAAGLYRLFGLPGQALSFVLRFLAVCCDRPGRFAGLLLITALLTGSAWWADLI